MGRLVLLLALCMVPAATHADPVSAFIYGAQTALTGAAVGATVSAAFTVGYVTTNFLIGTTFGNILLNVGLSALVASINRPRRPDVEAARVNSRTGTSFRWQAVGSVLVGGEAATFGEYDEDGNFWYIIAHADAEMIDPSAARYFLDGIEVELSDGTDGFTAGDVLTDAFCLTTKGDQYEGSGTRLPIFRLFTVTPDTSSAYGALPAALTTAFPELPADFRLTGVAFTIVRCRGVKPENYGKAYRWRGAFALGEPAVTVYADFSRVYDPRDPAQDLEDPTTWASSGNNPALIWAWWRTHQFGRRKPMSQVNWDQVAAAADKCDETVLDRSAVETPLYRCGLAFRDDVARSECEADILATMDAFVAYDDEGKAYPVPGFYEAPTLEFTVERDIFTAQTDTTADGEAPMDGVICEYLSPEHGFQKVQAAPWVNTDWYDGVSEPQYVTIQALGCQNHNQAVRLAKAHGRRVQATRRGAFGTTIKGILAKGRRGVLIEYDAQFTGAHQIVGPVEEDATGMLARFPAVPMQADDWLLNEGEEGAPPQVAPSLDIDNTLGEASGVVVSAVQVALSGSFGVRLEAIFDAPTRPDRIYRFRYTPAGGSVYEYFTTDMEQTIAYSALVDDGTDYDVSWQTVTAGGRATDWTAPVTITATANTTPPPALVAAGATGGVGEATVTYTTANSANQGRVAIFRDTVAVKPGSPITTRVAAGNISGTYSDTGLAAGTYYYWIDPQNASGVAGTGSGPFTATVT